MREWLLQPANIADVISACLMTLFVVGVLAGLGSRT